MKTLIDDFNILYPAYSAKQVSGTVTVEESEAEDSAHFVRKISIDQFDGWQFPHEISKENSSLHKSCQAGASGKLMSHELMRKDCDGLLAYQTKRSHVIMAVEIKTSYSSDDILKAVRQIIGSVRKLENMMELLQDHYNDKLKYKGVIISRAASTAQILGWKDMRDPTCRTLVQLAKGKPKFFPKADLEKLFHPLSLRDVEIVNIAVAPTSKEVSVSHQDLCQRWQV